MLANGMKNAIPRNGISWNRCHSFSSSSAAAILDLSAASNIISVTGSRCAATSQLKSAAVAGVIKLNCPTRMASTWEHTLKMDNLNPCIKTMEYAVRGPLVIRATEIEKELQNVSESTHVTCYALRINFNLGSSKTI